VANHDPVGMDLYVERVLGRSPCVEWGMLARRHPAGVVYRVREVLSDDRPERDPFFREMLYALGFSHAVHALVAHRGLAYGLIAMLRRSERGDFDDRHLSFLRAVLPHIAQGFRTAVANAVRSAAPGRGFGIVLLGPSGEIEAKNAVAEQLLALNRVSPVRVAAQMMFSAVGAGGAPSMTFVDPATGERYRMWTERLEGPAPRGMVLIEPASRADDAGLLLQFGLTLRETQVAHAMLRGMSHQDAGAALGLSAHTVSHHVKRIFKKLGVGSRRELSALLLGAA
jgi:DNA-binding CsgD family transcriptional regulator